MKRGIDKNLMNKKGSDIAISPLILIALGVLVLVILVFVFRDQITRGGQRYTDIADQAQLDDTKCSFLQGRRCSDSPCKSGEEKVVSQASMSCGKATGEKTRYCCEKDYGSKTPSEAEGEKKAIDW